MNSYQPQSCYATLEWTSRGPRAVLQAQKVGPCEDGRTPPGVSSGLWHNARRLASVAWALAQRDDDFARLVLQCLAERDQVVRDLESAVFSRDMWRQRAHELQQKLEKEQQ